MATTDTTVNNVNAGGTQGGGEAFLDGLQSFGAELGQALPDILAALAVLVLGIIVANVLGNLVRRLVVWSRLDQLVKSSGATTNNLDQNDIKFKAADFARGLVKWSVILLAIGIAADILQWTQITELMNSIVAYLPNIVAAVLLLIGGYLLGNFIGSVVSGMDTNLGQRAAQTVGNIARWAIFVLAGMAALIQLGIAESIIQIAFIGLMAMISLAGGLAFGLGGRDKARELLSEVRPQRPTAA